MKNKYGIWHTSNSPRISKGKRKGTISILLKTLEHGTRCLIVDPSEDVSSLKQFIKKHYKIPVEYQRLRFGTRDLIEGKTLSSYRIYNDSIIRILLRVIGGKGGFGALLRGQGRDIKATTNFDACRDLNGRRMRHVNAEKKLAEWAKDQEQRDLENIAINHIKEKIKEAKKEYIQKVDVEKIQKKQEVTVERVKNAVNEILNGKDVCKSLMCNKRRIIEEEPVLNVKKSKFAHFDSDGDDSDEDESSSTSSSPE